MPRSVPCIVVGQHIGFGQTAAFWGLLSSRRHTLASKKSRAGFYVTLHKWGRGMIAFLAISRAVQ